MGQVGRVSPTCLIHPTRPEDAPPLPHVKDIASTPIAVTGRASSMSDFVALTKPRLNLLVVATSSAPWRIDPALRSVGRLDRGAFVPPPDLLGRGRIIVDRLSFLPISPDVNPGELAVETEGFTARELISMVSAAAEHALCVSRHSGTLWAIQQRDLRRAFERLEGTARDWFTRAHGHLRNGSNDVDPVYDYIRRHIRAM